MKQQLISDLYDLFSELTYPHKDGAIHAEPTVVYELTSVECFARHFKSDDHLFPIMLPTDIIFPVEVENGYITGYVLDGYVYPFVAARADIHGAPGMVKIRIDGMVNIPLLRTDGFYPQFFNQRGSRPAEKIHYAIRHDAQ